MHTRNIIAVLAGTVTLVVAKPHPLPQPALQRRQAGLAFNHPGVATFNNYMNQKTSTCFPEGIRKSILCLNAVLWPLPPVLQRSLKLTISW